MRNHNVDATLQELPSSPECAMATSVVACLMTVYAVAPVLLRHLRPRFMRAKFGISFRLLSAVQSAGSMQEANERTDEGIIEDLFNAGAENLRNFDDKEDLLDLIKGAGPVLSREKLLKASVIRRTSDEALRSCGLPTGVITALRTAFGELHL